jgi:single-strand DNA-binding protein
MINKAILIGRLGKDPEKRTTPNGKVVCRFTMATDSGFGDNRKTDWHSIVCFDRQAEFVSNYLRKGSMVYVEGRISYNNYEKDGQKRTFTEIVANTVQSLSSRNESGAAGGNFDVAQYDTPAYGGGSQSYGSSAPAAQPASNDSFGGNGGISEEEMADFPF